MSTGCESPVFWGEIAPCEHLVQIYEDDDVFLDSLEGFVSEGLKAGDGVLVIATASHLKALEPRLRALDIDLDAAAADDQYIALDAERTLCQFIVNGWPDERVFTELVTMLIERACGDGRPVRAFGEMVAVLWSQGHQAATIRLEHLWHKIWQQKTFSLFCAYPRTGFTQDAHASIKEICEVHSKVFAL